MKDFILRNLPVKLLSLGLAVVFWLLIGGEQEIATSIAVPVQYRNLPKDLETTSDLSEKVHLDIRGPSGKLSPASIEAVVLQFDLAGVSQPGDRTLAVRAENASLPSGVVLDRAVPSQIRLRFEQRMTKDVPVRVRIGKQPPSGFEVVAQRTVPERIRIVGPESRVADETSVETDAVDLSGVTETSELRVPVYVGDSQVRIDGRGEVALTVQIKRKE